jgi:hypothetical protein
MFSAPISFREARESRQVRSVLPTSLGSAELETIQTAILERATFSARVTSAEYLQEIDDVLRDYIDGKIDLASARAQLKEKLREIGYVAAPGEADSIKDFSSDLRTNLVLRTNAEMAHGYGQWVQGQDPDILDQWPAQELYRGAPAMVPRNWIARWSAAGGSFPGGRMIALKNSGIWPAISRFGAPYPPFDFNSHMVVRDVDRDTAIELGLIDRDTQIAPDDRGFNDDLRFAPAVRSAALRTALTESDPRLTFTGDVLTLRPSP